MDTKRDRTTADDRRDPGGRLAETEQGLRSDKFQDPLEQTAHAAHSGPQRTVDVTGVRPGEPNAPDEAGDVSIANADNPMLVREEVKNTSDSSGLRVDDEARGEKLKEQAQRGAREISPMD